MGEEGDIKMLLNIPRVSSAKFRKTFHEAMNQAAGNASEVVPKFTVCFHTWFHGETKICGKRDDGCRSV